MSADLPPGLPEEVHRLGGAQAVYRPSRKYVIGVYALTIILAVYVAIVLVIAGFLLWKPPQKPRELAAAWGLLGLALFLLLAGVVTLLVYRRRLRQRVVVAPGGLALCWPGGATVVAWGELVAVRPRIVHIYRGGMHVGTRYSYLLRRRDGAQLKLTDFFADVQQIGSRAEEEWRRRQA